MKDAVATTDGRMLSENQIRHYLRVNILAGSIGMGWWAIVMGMPLTLLLEALGASGLQMGLIVTLMQVSMITQLPGALCMDRLKARKPLWLPINLAARAIWIVVPLLLMLMSSRPLVVAQVILVLVGISSMLNSAMGAAWWSWMADLVPEHLRARFWGARQSWTMAAYLVATAVSGYILDHYSGSTGGGRLRGFELLFLVASVLGVADLVVHAGIPETPPGSVVRGVHWLKRLARPMTHPDFRRQTIAMGVYTFAMGLVSLGVVFLKKDFNASYSQLSAIMITANVGTIIVGFAGGYIMQRIGGRAFGATMLSLAPLIMVSWFFVSATPVNLHGLFNGKLAPFVHMLLRPFPSSWDVRLEGLLLPQVIWAFLVVNFFSGFIHGGMGVCQMSMIGALAPKEGRTVAMAVHWCVVGLIGAAGSLIAGNVMDYFSAHPLSVMLPSGMPMAFHHVLIVAHVLILWGIAVPLQLRVTRRTGEPDFAMALSRLMIVNPLRAVTNIYTMSTAVTSSRRAAAVRTLGQERIAIAVSDLIERLDDPSSDVREESALALGRIGSREAVDALLLKLNDPHSDLAPEIARALRQAPDPRSVDALVRRLEDPDRETASESARTLGAIGDRRAVPSLLDLLEKSEDAKIVSASSEALARIGELAAIYEILPRMKEARNPVLKRSLAVAIGDLLGEREGFYRVLVREHQARGSEAETMLKDLRHDIAAATERTMSKEGHRLQDKAREAQAAYESGRLDACADALFDLAVGLAALNWGVTFGGDAAGFLPDLVWRDEQFGVGVWYLCMLRSGFDAAKLGPVDDTDVLLGMYFLYSRGVKRVEPKPHLLSRAVRSPWRRGSAST